VLCRSIPSKPMPPTLQPVVRAAMPRQVILTESDTHRGVGDADLQLTMASAQSYTLHHSGPTAGHMRRRSAPPTMALRLFCLVAGVAAEQ
jgi:hypothetical protein